jgi:hypothetical protein
MTVGSFFETVYAELRRVYQCEYVFKNEIIRRLFLSRHDPTASVVIPEFAVGCNRIDLVVVNGTTTAYEIKTAYDSLERLARQIEAALRVFDRVVVVCDSKHVAAVDTLVGHLGVGVLSYTGRGTFRVEQRWISNVELVQPRAIFDCLRAKEYIPALRAVIGSVPVVPNTLTYRTFAPMFATLSSTTAHGILVKSLRKRFAGQTSADALKRLPSSMTQMYYESSRADRVRLFTDQVLSSPLIST